GIRRILSLVAWLAGADGVTAAGTGHRLVIAAEGGSHAPGRHAERLDRHRPQEQDGTDEEDGALDQATTRRRGDGRRRQSSLLDDRALGENAGAVHDHGARRGRPGAPTP